MRLQQSLRSAVTAAVGVWTAMCASAAFAQMTPQTADMTVTGTIVPAACSASFTGDGVVDFGTIKLVDLPENEIYLPGARDVELLVKCASSKRVSFTAVDLQSANKVTDLDLRVALGVPASYLYGLGTGVVSGARVNLGSYMVEMRGGTVDGANRTIFYSNDGGATWGGGAAGTVDHLLADGKTPFSLGIWSPTPSLPVSGMAFRFPLRIVAALDRGSRLQVAEDTPLNGQLVFAIRYQ